MANSIYIFHMKEDGTLIVTSMKGADDQYPDFTKAKGFNDLPIDMQEQITLFSDLLSDGDPLTDFLNSFGDLGIDPLTRFLINSGGSLDSFLGSKQQRGSQPKAPMCPPGHQFPNQGCDETCPAATVSTAHSSSPFQGKSTPSK